MNGTVFALLLAFVGNALAHSGHDVPLLHIHLWDWLGFAFGIAAVASIAIWRAK